MAAIPAYPSATAATIYPHLPMHPTDDYDGKRTDTAITINLHPPIHPWDDYDGKRTEVKEFAGPLPGTVDFSAFDDTPAPTSRERWNISEGLNKKEVELISQDLQINAFEHVKYLGQMNIIFKGRINSIVKEVDSIHKRRVYFLVATICIVAGGCLYSEKSFGIPLGLGLMGLGILIGMRGLWLSDPCRLFTVHCAELCEHLLEFRDNIWETFGKDPYSPDFVNQLLDWSCRRELGSDYPLSSIKEISAALNANKQILDFYFEEGCRQAQAIGNLTPEVSLITMVPDRLWTELLAEKIRMNKLGPTGKKIDEIIRSRNTESKADNSSTFRSHKSDERFLASRIAAHIDVVKKKIDELKTVICKPDLLALDLLNIVVEYAGTFEEDVRDLRINMRALGFSSRFTTNSDTWVEKEKMRVSMSWLNPCDYSRGLRCIEKIRAAEMSRMQTIAERYGHTFDMDVNSRRTPAIPRF